MRPNPDEVDAVLFVTLDELLLDEVYREERWSWTGDVVDERRLFFFELVGDTVWGATGAMVRQLLGLALGIPLELDHRSRWSTTGAPDAGRVPGGGARARRVVRSVPGVARGRATPDPTVEPGWVRSQLPSSAPAEAEPWADVLADLDRVVVPALTHWQSPRFLAYFPGNSSPAAVLGELATAVLGQQGMLWATSSPSPPAGRRRAGRARRATGPL